MLKRALAVTCISVFLSACASNQSNQTIPLSDLNDPATTPVEKWSDAMVVAKAMKIGGLYDIPKELAYSNSSNSAQSVSGGVDVATAATGVAAGAPGANMGFALAGAGIVFNMLSDTTNKPLQIAAWVPRSLANSLEEAHEVTVREFASARNKITEGKAKPLNTETRLAPDGMIYNKQLFAENALMPGVTPPIGDSKQESIGPIFIMQGSAFYLDRAHLGTDRIHDYAKSISEVLPDWFFVYAPGRDWPNDKYPAVIYNKGQKHYFISK